MILKWISGGLEIFYIICEGPNDGSFLGSILENKFTMRPIIEKKLSNALRLLRKMPRKRYYKDSIILVDRGKPQIFWKYLQRLIIEGFSIVCEDVNILLVADTNGYSSKQLSNYYNKLERSVRGQLKEIEVQNNKKQMKITSKRKVSYSMTLYSFFIPRSLEFQLVEKSFHVNDEKLKECGINTLKEKDVHELLNLITECLNFNSKSDFIKSTVSSNWFKTDQWFKQLCQQIKIVNI